MRSVPNGYNRNNLKNTEKVCLFFLCTLLVCFSSRADKSVSPESYVPVQGFFELENWSSQPGATHPSLTTFQGQKALRFVTDFQETNASRAVWDLKLYGDLAETRGIQLKFYVPDSSPIPPITAYFRSGKSWYTLDMFADATQPDKNGCATICLLKSATQCEGIPQGWGKIDGLRLAAWRTDDKNASFLLCDPALIVSNTPIAIIRAESAVNTSPGDARAAFENAAIIDALYAAMGLQAKVISDLDLSPKTLRGIRLVVLPCNPVMPETALSVLQTFLRQSGKILVFGKLPALLDKEMNLRLSAKLSPQYEGQFNQLQMKGLTSPYLPASMMCSPWEVRQIEPLAAGSQPIAEWCDRDGKSTGKCAIAVSDMGVLAAFLPSSSDQHGLAPLLLYLTERFLPDSLQTAVQYQMTSSSILAEYSSFDEAIRAISGSLSRHPEAKKSLELAIKMRASAQKAVQSRGYPEAYKELLESRRALLEAWLATLEPSPSEHRAFWCHSPFGAGGLGWDATVRNLAENGFNTLLANLAWAGCAFYRSQTLPESPEVKTRGNQLVACLSACKKYGVACHVWKVCWNLGTKVPAAFLERIERENRLQVRRDGKTLKNWLCPSHPANRQLEIDAATEIASQYDVQGIHLDYVRFESSNTCFCNTCKKQFEAFIGQTVTDWPNAVDTSGRWNAQWLEFRRNTITATVKEISAAVRKINPKLQISAAVFPDWPIHRNQVGQDWKEWCEKGYVDFVCPMTYTSYTPLFESMVRLQKDWAGRAACYPGIGMSVWRNENDPITLVNNIQVTRKLQTGGFTVFDLKEPVARFVLPALGKGITRPKP
ncbi:MAG TPA: family 10 glycosylhydrolase [Candidatus Hydrogenedentes bacterium]|nr:family 10 glycosylhydrolase [Candidatus Hydrogenedentota bacterium]HOL77786.1 family 10 glycosylhydrolase [Candidatus Hydrogenedentota bacterium]HPO86400.1 family 10 glycosylhydrolase [Candidatus Hydrogenedentota bacterium]